MLSRTFLGSTYNLCWMVCDGYCSVYSALKLFARRVLGMKSVYGLWVPKNCSITNNQKS
jgi:hypothetical protein